MEVVFVWIFFSVIVGLIGNGRQIGFAGGFFLSLLLSPLIGFIIVLVSKSQSTVIHEQTMLKTQQATLSTLQNSKPSIADEIEKLTKLKEQGSLSEDDFNLAKSKLLQ